MAFTPQCLLTLMKYHVFGNFMENGAFAPKGANAPFSIIFSKVSSTLLNFFSMSKNRK